MGLHAHEIDYYLIHCSRDRFIAVDLHLLYVGITFHDGSCVRWFEDLVKERVIAADGCRGLLKYVKPFGEQKKRRFKIRACM